MLGTRPVEVSVLGQKFHLKSKNGDPEIIEEVLGLVADRLKEVETRTKGAAPHQIALLALMDLAEEFIKAKKRMSGYQQELNEKADKLVSLLETELK